MNGKNQDYEVIASDAIEPVANSIALIERAEIDTQIATAHQYPRSLSQFKSRALSMVTLDRETAESCIYRRPVGKESGRMKYAEGKSVRLAEIVGACYGNLRVAAMIVEQTERFVKCRGMAHDLESNFAASSEVIESTVTKEGKPYSERMRIVVAKAALSKARRDAIFQVVPAALCKTLEDQARKTAIGDGRTIDKRREDVMKWINLIGVDQKRVWSALGITGIDDVGLNELETLTGIRTAIKDGDVSIDEAFPRDKNADPATAEDLEAKLKNGNGKAKEYPKAQNPARKVLLDKLNSLKGSPLEESLTDDLRNEWSDFKQKPDKSIEEDEANEWLDIFAAMEK